SMPRRAKAASTMARTCASASCAVPRPDHSMMTPNASSLKPMPTAAAICSPGASLVMAPYAVGVSEPGGMSSSSTNSARGGKMLLTRSKFKLPIPAASNALSNAFSVVGPSAAPATRVNFFGVGSNACDLLPAEFTPASIPEGGRPAIRFCDCKLKNFASPLLLGSEEASDLGDGRLGAVRRVHDVVRKLGGKVAPDGARRRVYRIRRADQAAHVGDGVGSLDD